MLTLILLAVSQVGPVCRTGPYGLGLGSDGVMAHGLASCWILARLQKVRLGKADLLRGSFTLRVTDSLNPYGSSTVASVGWGEGWRTA